MAERPEWFRTAVFYEAPVHAFADGNDDGIGDFEGLIGGLDYLQWLGVSCIWLLPFYPSPLADGGYDVADFIDVHKRHGTVDDVRRLLEEAHARGIRVIADLVLNHTSDQHPWFQESRRPGSAKRDWYVWSDDPTQWDEVRVIFTDTNDSNWTWDDEAGAWYWHRFFDHQPDLNFANPEVRDAMDDVARFWLDLGFDGYRLDAVAYLFERDGTNGENLPETHAYLKHLRAMIDAEYPDRVLLAEVNQWPDDAVAYFGDGDECHMVFNFPVMPRLFLSLATGNATYLSEILANTPEIPAGCQWGVFLRNHDELTLEMVSDVEREMMYRYYAPDPAMRKNVGIRRRLAPLLGGDRKRVELLYGLLLSLPGSPVIYYGDEIGMGDMYLLNDRDGVRTPMQWSAEPGAGFSRADPSTFYLPLVDAPGFTPAEVNVELQLADPGSLLHWVHTMLSVRARHPVFGAGAYEPVATGNPAVLAYLRRGPGETILVVANFSEEEQVARLHFPPDLDVRRFVDLVAGSGTPILDPGEPFHITGHRFNWLEMVKPIPHLPGSRKR